MLPEQQNLNQTMLNSEQLTSLKLVTSNLSPLQLAWASGYLAAQAENASVNPSLSVPAQAPKASSVLTILYGSQTGNAKGVAKALAAKASAEGLSVECLSMAEFKPKSITKVSHLLIVASTNGEGEPPDDAVALHEFLASKKAPKLPELHYSVLALGDTSYEFFCQTGKDFDQFLTNLGAKQIAPRIDCDVDYEEAANAWSADIVTKAKSLVNAEGYGANVITMPTVEVSSAYSKQNPFAAEFSLSQKITGRDSAKDVRHIEISLADSGIHYQPGDALGVWFENDPQLVAELLAKLSFSGDESVTISGESVSLKQALVEKLEITQTSVHFVKYWAELTQDATLLALIADGDKLREYSSKHQLIDVISGPARNLDAQSFVDALRKITPRLYSIASSQQEVDEEVHLTVGLVEYEENGKLRAGGASSYLGKRLQDGDKVKVFIEHNDNFRLPQDGNTPVIMIGPGTGIAPFRAFMQEREATDASGDNWLFFGDQTFTQDFLYQVEWQSYLKSGLLTKISLAFSRDQQEKIYVQHRLKENATEVYQWLERGAHIYVCGDMSRMAKDVEQALVEIIASQGQKTEVQAQEYLKELRNAKRYQKDVY